MKKEQFQQSIDRHLSSVSIDSQMRQKILNQCTFTVLPKKSSFKKSVLKKILASAAVCCVVLSAAFICAAGSTPLQISLSKLGSEVAMMLQPINTTSAYDGIEMNLLAAMSDEDMVVVYLTLQDTQQKNRIDDTIHIADFETKSQRFSEDEVLFSNLDVLWYDHQTQTATLRLMGQAQKEIKNSKISLDIRSFLSGKSYQPMVPTGYTLADVAEYNSNPFVEYPSKIEAYSCSGELMEELEKQASDGKIPILSDFSQEPLQAEAFPWLKIENIGIVNDRLHTQISYDQNMGRFNNFALKLAEKTSHEEIDTSQLILQLETFDASNQPSYTAKEEQILAIPQDISYDELELFTSSVMYKNYVQGNWNATFKIQDTSTSSKGVNCRIDTSYGTVNHVEISPIGVTVYGQGEIFSDNEDSFIKIYQKNGTLVECSGSSVNVQGDSVKIKEIFETPINPNDIEKVIINETVISFNF